MNKFFLLLCLFVFVVSHAQSNDEIAVKRAIDTFYDGFNSRDSVKMKSMLSTHMVYQNIREYYGNKMVKSEDLNEIIRTIMAIPKNVRFKQELDNVKINVDSQIANVWVTYKFFLYDAYYHCGSSSFQLAKEYGDWKIISLLDHYSKEACNP